MASLNKLIFITLVLTHIAFTQDDSILQLFPGKWKMETNKAEIYEEWIVQDENELVAKSYRIDDGAEVVSEILYLKKYGEQWAYVAVPEGQNITLFALIEYTPMKFVFENLEHDFPQRIIYEFRRDGKLTSSIEGIDNGENKRIEFSFTLAD